MIELRPEFRFSSQIWPILPGLRPFCLDLAHFGWIWAILLGFGPYSLDLSPKGDEALRMGLGGDLHENHVKGGGLTAMQMERKYLIRIDNQRRKEKVKETKKD